MFLCLQLYKEIEICPKDTKVIQFDKAESCTIGYGMTFFKVLVHKIQTQIHWIINELYFNSHPLAAHFARSGCNCFAV